jgi:hypothetical protein
MSVNAPGSAARSAAAALRELRGRRPPSAGARQRERAGAWLAAGLGVSAGGSVLNLLAFLDEVNARTHRPLPLGLAVLVNFVPAGVLMPFIGRLLAGRDLRGLAILLGVVQAALAAAMAVVIVTRAPLLLLYVASAVLWLLVQVTRICISTVLPAYVPRERLRTVNLTLQIGTQLGATGAALAVVAVGGASAAVLFTVDAATFVGQSVIIAMAVPSRVARSGGAHIDQSRPDATVLRRRWRMVLLLPSGYITINALNLAIPLVVLQGLHRGESSYAAANAVYPAAAVLVGWLLRRRGGTSLPPSLLVLSAGWVGFALSRSLFILLVAVAVTAVGVITSNASGMAWAQERAPGDLSAIQSWATTYGSLVTTAIVIALTVAFEHELQAWAFAALAALFAACALAARATAHPPAESAARPAAS